MEIFNRLGIKYISSVQCSKINETKSNKVVVYSNSNKHDDNDKIVMNIEEAKLVYGNKLASPYISDYDRVLKIYWIGRKRYRFSYERGLEIDGKLVDGGIRDYDCKDVRYNRDIKKPMYSMNYIITSGGAIATSFNIVPNLSSIKDYIMCDEDIVTETERAIRKNDYK